MILRSFMTAVFVFFLGRSFTQEFNLVQLIDSAKHYRTLVLDLETNSSAISNNQVFSDFLQKIILKKGQESIIGIDSTLKIAYLLSEDKKVEVYSWEVPKKDGSFQYFSYVNYHHKKGNKLTELVFNPDIVINNALSYKKLNPSNWYGGIYYKIIQVKFKKKVQYVLALVNKSDPLISKKVIEALHFSRNGSCTLGADVFYEGRRFKRRQILLYGSNVHVSVIYDKANKQIIYDHLSPSVSSMEGNYQFYGPDFSFDGYQFIKGKWYFTNDINYKGDYNKPYNPKGKLKEKDIYKP